MRYKIRHKMRYNIRYKIRYKIRLLAMAMAGRDGQPGPAMAMAETYFGKFGSFVVHHHRNLHRMSRRFGASTQPSSQLPRARFEGVFFVHLHFDIRFLGNLGNNNSVLSCRSGCTAHHQEKLYILVVLANVARLLIILVHPNYANS